MELAINIDYCELELRADRLRHIAGTAWSTKRYLNIGRASR
jgi:hypothetical protein